MISSTLLLCLIMLGIILCTNLGESFRFAVGKRLQIKSRFSILSTQNSVSYEHVNRQATSNFPVASKSGEIIQIDSLRSLKKQLTAAGNRLVLLEFFVENDGKEILILMISFVQYFWLFSVDYCKRAEEFYTKMAASPQYASVIFLQVRLYRSELILYTNLSYAQKANTDIAKEVAEFYDVTTSPTFLFMRNRRQIERFDGPSKWDIIRRTQYLM